MSQASPQTLRRQPAVASGVIGMIVFIATEIMLFAGLISAHAITRATNTVWPPPGQPRLPIELTGFATSALICSGVILFWAGRNFASDRGRAQKQVLAALGLGLLFVLLQGYEWVQLLGEGLRFTGSTFGSFFYLIVGLHALHAVAAIVALGWVYRELRAERLQTSALQTASLFWYFVVCIWPVIYTRVYL